MKILDRYILFAYLKTFFAVFTILMFIFVLQTIWMYISELAGKDLDTAIVLKFLWFVSPTLIPLVLPLTILVASLMVFGSLSENYEFAAMKSTGISLQRAMGSLMFFIIILSAVAFIFANNVIPYSQYKWKNLRRNISQISPAMAITEGQFSPISDDFNIKVEKKSGENGQYLDQVIIHTKNSVNPNINSTVIKAEKGELKSQLGSNTLSLVLMNGNYYDDVQTRNTYKNNNLPFVKSYFDEYIINIDLSQMNDVDMDEENNFNDQSMFSISELHQEIDSLAYRFSYDIKTFTEETYFRTGMTQLYPRKDQTNEKVPEYVIKNQQELLNRYKDTEQEEIITLAINNVKHTQQQIQAKKRDFSKK